MTERQKFDLQMKCKQCYMTLVTRLKDKSSISYALVINLRCFDPFVIVEFTCTNQFKAVLHKFVECGRIDERDL